MKIKATKDYLEMCEHTNRVPYPAKSHRSVITVKSAITVRNGDQNIHVNLTYDLNDVPTELIGLVIQAIDTWGHQVIEVE